MKSLDFLRQVLPARGVYCVVGIANKNGPVFQHFEETIDGLGSYIRDWLTQERNVYFALSTFKDGSSRKVENAAWCKSVFLDIEVEGDFHSAGYPGLDEIEEALQRFLADTGLPPPWTVHSGYGVHVYWPFTTEVSIAEWRPVAEAFKAMVLDKGLRIDTSVTADAARVLRVPNTVNFKNPEDARWVFVGRHGTPIEFSVLREIVADYIKPTKAAPAEDAPKLELEGKPPGAGHSALAEALAGNEEAVFAKIVKRTLADDGCEQLRYYLLHAKEQNVEPLWRALLSVATYCTDRESATRKLTALHPFTWERAEQKLSAIKGPYSCAAIHGTSQAKGACESCKHRGKIHGPLMLGKQLRMGSQEHHTPKAAASDEEESSESPEEPPAASSPPQPAASQAQPTTLQYTAPPLPSNIPTLPDPYQRGVNGGIYVLRRNTDADGNTTTEHELVTNHDLFFVAMVQFEGNYSIRALYFNPIEGWREIHIPGDKLAPDKLKTVLDSSGIPVSDAESKKVAIYLITVSKHLTYTARSIMVPSHMGWIGEDIFVHGTTAITNTGRYTVPPCPVATNQLVNLVPRGSFDRWKQIIGLYAQPDAYKHLTGFLSTFGSVLMRKLPVQGVVVHFGARSSGTGKTTIMRMINSVWGAPEKLIVQADTSNVAVQQIMGVMHDMAVTVDEIGNQKIDRLRSLVMTSSYGKGKDRLDSQARAKTNNTYWNSHLILASNHSLSTLLEDEGANIEPELRRIVDIPVTRPAKFTHEQSSLFNELDQNYGWAGPAFVEYLIKHEAEVGVEIERAYAKLRHHCSPSNDERFWVAWAVSLLAAIPLAQRAKVIDFDCSHAERYIYTLYTEQRRISKKLRETATEILARYINSFFNQFLIVTDMGGGAPGTSMGFKSLAESRFTPKDIRGRLEKVEGRDEAKLFIEEAAFRHWCQHMKRLEMNELLDELEKERPIKRNQMVKLFADTGLSMNLRLACVEIDVSVKEDIETAMPDEKGN